MVSKCLVFMNSAEYPDIKNGDTTCIIDLSNKKLYGEPVKLYTINYYPVDTVDNGEVLDILLNENPSKVYLIGNTVDVKKMLYTITQLLMYWRVTGAPVYVIIDGKPEPLPGYFVPAMRFSKNQFRILKIVYGSDVEVSGKTLITEYSMKFSIYKTLRDLKRKGLLDVKRGRLERTAPGRLLVRLIELVENKGFNIL